jgi:hypothetical protein
MTRVEARKCLELYKSTPHSLAGERREQLSLNSCHGFESLSSKPPEAHVATSNVRPHVATLLLVHDPAVPGREASGSVSHDLPPYQCVELQRRR